MWIGLLYALVIMYFESLPWDSLVVCYFLHMGLLILEELVYCL
jgi:hypothetical protein